MASAREKLTYANVMSTIAVVIAVASSSTAVAINVKKKVPKNSVTSKSIKNGSITGKDLAGVRVETFGAAPLPSRS
ncbi:hypothetical protein BH20ACT15_BH20ACT15_03590 [soil metagenome]